MKRKSGKKKERKLDDGDSKVMVIQDKACRKLAAKI